MKQADTFVASALPYALNLATLDTRWGKTWTTHAVDGMWFRRKRGGITVTSGRIVISTSGVTRLAEAVDRAPELLGTPHFTWDGTTFWSRYPVRPSIAVFQEARMRAWLERFPAVPDGFNGGWVR
jgi:hypothetical protein